MGGRDQTIKTEDGGKLYNIAAKYLEKAKAHWARKSEQRKQPGNCGRCGKPNLSKTHKHCDECRDYQRRRKQAARIKPVVVDESALAKLERRIAAMEHNFDMMRLNARAVYKRAYEAGRRSGANARYFDAYPVITKQELAKINHAYDSGTLV